MGDVLVGEQPGYPMQQVESMAGLDVNETHNFLRHNHKGNNTSITWSLIGEWTMCIRRKCNSFHIELEICENLGTPQVAYRRSSLKDSLRTIKSIRFNPFHVLRLFIKWNQVNCSSSAHLRLVFRWLGGTWVPPSQRKNQMKLKENRIYSKQ